MKTLFAYGSNLLLDRIRARCPSAKDSGIASAGGYRLVFHKVSRRKNGMTCGKATLIAGTHDDVVHGVLYQISETDYAALNEMEKGYHTSTIHVHQDDQPDLVPVRAHIANAVDASLKPYDWYHGLVVVGALQNHLPLDYIEQLKQTRTICDPGFEKYRDAREAYAILQKYDYDI